MPKDAYVLVTPARNEEATIATTIQSVLSQTLLPREWVIVSDRSTDRTDQIVAEYAGKNDFIRLLRIEGGGTHSFASVVRAFERGIAALQCVDYCYLGLLDADVRFPANYFERLMHEFERDSSLGLAGGLVQDVGERMPRKRVRNLKDVAGATQFFRRQCFEGLGGLLPIPEGGWDALTCVRARMLGFKTATFPDLVMDHLKPRNIAQGGILSRMWQLGVRDYALGYHPLFLLAKCCSRWYERPLILGAFSRLVGYCWASLKRDERRLPDELIRYLRREQLQRLNPFTHR